MTREEMCEAVNTKCSDYDCCSDGCPLKGKCDLCSAVDSNDSPIELVEQAYNTMFGTSERIDEEQTHKVVDVTEPSQVSHPSHYNQGGIECLDAMIAAYGKEATATFCLTNAFKYLWRTEHKNGIQDIDKAIWYLNKYKELKGSD